MRRVLTTMIALALAATTAHAGTSAPGVSLNWDRCFGDGSVQYKQFACDANVGSDRLVGTFELAQDFAGVTGIEIGMDVGSLSNPLPAWWRVNFAGSCRTSGLTTTLAPPPGSIACTDWAGGQAAGGIAAYQIDTFSPNRARLRLGTAVPAPIDLFAGQEYFQFTLNLGRSKTTGTGACAGCTDPVVIFLTSARLTPTTGPSLILNRGANYSGSQWVSWQNGYPTNVVLPPVCEFNPIIPNHCALNQTTFFTVLPYSVTPTRNSTWGQVKSLYR